MKDCGSCAVCCKFLDIPSIEKKADTWCQYCDPGRHHACNIYERRPKECTNFHCFWQAEEWYDWLRPDRCGVLFESLPGVETIMVSTDKSDPDVWKIKRICNVIEILKRKGRPVIIRTKNDTQFAIPEGWSIEKIMADLKTVLDGVKS